jgi:hypothetical protein
MRTIFYHRDSSAQGDTILDKAMVKLCNFLSIPPLEVQCHSEVLPRKLVKPIYRVFEKTPVPDNWTAAIDELFRKEYGSQCKLLILCSPQNRLAQLSLHYKSDAEWGITCPQNDSILSIVYNLNNAPVIWHEALHLLGADECYDPDNIKDHSNCKLLNCVMQYAPTEQTVGRQPILCNKTIQAVRTYCTTWK